jgi:predicted PurR-regulated permease PerM
MERALASYVKGQAALSLIIGASSGFGLWVLGMLGLMPNGGKYAVLFGVWAGITELIPYVGPWLGAAPPVVYALVEHPLSALWVALLFLGIQQLEGHVVVPKVMGHSLRLHPLLVIFGLLAGGEIYGFPGILVALPLLAAARAVWEFFSERIAFARWESEQGIADAVGLEVVPPESARPIAR